MPYGSSPWAYGAESWASTRRSLNYTDLMGPLEIVSNPGGLLVSLATARAHLRYDDDDTSQNALITRYLRTAQQYCESCSAIEGGYQMTTATYDLPVACWWPGRLKLPRGIPLQSVSSVKYYATDGTLTTWAASNYIVRTPASSVGTVERAPLVVWPALQADRQYPIVIRFVAGCQAPVTAVAATDVLTSTGRAMADNDRVRMRNVGGALPAGLSEDTDYWVISASGQTFQLSTAPGGSAVDITGTGTGLHFCGLVPDVVEQAILMLVGHYDNNREGVVVDNRVASKVIDLAVTDLLGTLLYGFYS